VARLARLMDILSTWDFPGFSASRRQG
jgi:hypothetical protein